MRVVRYFVLGLFALVSVKAQQIGVGRIDGGVATAVIVGAAGAAVGIGIGITYFVIHDREIATGCIAESGEKKTLVGSDKNVYSLLDSGPPLHVGDRVKLKGHKSGAASARSFRVEKVLKDYGPCR
jgi:hypothetical protein